MLKILIVLFYSLNLFAFEISIRIIAPKESSQQYIDASRYFFDLVIKQCNLDISTNYQTIDKAIPKFTNFESYKKNIDGMIFRYYQEDLYNAISANNLHHNQSTIDIIEVESLSRHCGFAFPEIQFTQDQTDLLEILKNRIVISKQKSRCGSFNRLVSHEMAHILIQDNPAHTCIINNKLQRCPDNNLLSDMVEIFTPPKRPNIPYFDDNIKLVPSLGTKITPEQCLKISDSLSLI